MRLLFLRGLDDRSRDALESELSHLTLGEGQEGFSRPAAHVLASGHEDPSRDTFAVQLRVDEQWVAVGIGALQPHPSTVGPDEATVVTFRGFSIDARWQGRGLGTRATALAVQATPRRFPAASTLRLTVHRDNVAGRRAYLRCGFVVVDEVMGRAGWEDVMHLALPHA